MTREQFEAAERYQERIREERREQEERVVESQQHTPGPWEADRATDLETAGLYYHQIDAAISPQEEALRRKRGIGYPKTVTHTEEGIARLIREGQIDREEGERFLGEVFP